jgi:hypothetical protein
MGKIPSIEKTQSQRRGGSSSDAMARPRLSRKCQLLKHSDQHAKHEPSAAPRSCFLDWQSIARLKHVLRACPLHVMDADRLVREHMSRGRDNMLLQILLPAVRSL